MITLTWVLTKFTEEEIIQTSTNQESGKISSPTIGINEALTQSHLPNSDKCSNI